MGWGQTPTQERLSLRRLSSDARARKADEGLSLTIDAVKSAFIERDAEKLAGCLGSMKVYVSLKSRMKESGYYTRSQLQFMFDKIFSDLRTRSFEYAPKDIIAADDRANLRSEWTYVALGSEKVVTESLHLTFEKEKDGWGISEIKASSR
jgi:hypothetical protein